MASLNLLTNASSTGDRHEWDGGSARLAVAGTFGGATVKMQVLGPDGATWIDAGPGATFTAAGHCALTLDQCAVRMHVSGGTPSGLYATLRGVRYG